MRTAVRRAIAGCLHGARQVVRALVRLPRRLFLAWPRQRGQRLEGRVRVLEQQHRDLTEALQALRGGGGVRYPIRVPDAALEAALERRLKREARERAEYLLTALASTRRANPARR